MLAETLMTPMCPFHGMIKLTYPVSDGRVYSRPVLVRIKDKCRGRIAGGSDDGRTIATTIDSREHLGGLVPCGLIDDTSLAVPLDVFVKLDRTISGQDIKDSGSCYNDCAIVYRDHLPSLFKQHSALMADVYDSFLCTHLDMLRDVDAPLFRNMERIKTRFALRRAPFYDEQCQPGFLAWLALRTPATLPSEGFGAFISRGKYTGKVLPKVVRPSVNIYSSHSSLWAFPEAVTHESFLVK
jgi:hypothetical protein